MRPLFLLIFSLIAGPSSAWAAACCGGGYAGSSVITNDDKAKLSQSLTVSETTIESVNEDGIWTKARTPRQVQTLKIEAARIFADRWQTGFSLPVMETRYRGESHQGLGDASTFLGYEYLPDWNYNPLRPKGTGYLQLTLPTGRSRFESEIGGTDSRGNGLWALGAGTILTKTWFAFDAFITAEIHRSFDKDIETSQIQGTVSPGSGHNIGFGFGYNINSYRVGTGVTWTTEDEINLKSVSGTSRLSGEEKYATASVLVSYVSDSQEWSGNLIYADQTLFGDPRNTSLSQSVSAQLIRKWSR